MDFYSGECLLLVFPFSKWIRSNFSYLSIKHWLHNLEECFDDMWNEKVNHTQPCWHTKTQRHIDILNFLLTDENLFILFYLWQTWVDTLIRFAIHFSTPSLKVYCLPFVTEIRFYSSSNKWWIILSFGLPQFYAASVWCRIQIVLIKQENGEYKIRSPNETPKLISIQTI